MHLKTLPDGKKVYSLIVLDGWSRVLLSEEICFSKGARDVCLILIKAFARWGMPQQILSDNAKAFWSLLYRLMLGRLRIKISYTHPGRPWENPFAESFIGTLRAYFYPHIQRMKTSSGVEGIYLKKTTYYNHRTHWAFRKDEVKTPLGKLAETRGRQLPQHFELSLLATGKRFPRKVDGHGFLSFKRYRLYVDTALQRQHVEIREFFDSLANLSTCLRHLPACTRKQECSACLRAYPHRQAAGRQWFIVDEFAGDHLPKRSGGLLWLRPVSK
jgi:hypothetical protein